MADKLPNGISRGINAVTVGVIILIMLLGIYTIYDAMYVYAFATKEQVVYKTRTERVEAMERSYADAIAWLYIEDTVDEPLMQGATNTEYLNKAPDGTYSLRGSLFVDTRNSADFTDEYTLVYGHHMSFYQMFGALDLYFDESYWTSTHTAGVITLKDDTDIAFEIVAMGSIDVSVMEIFDPTEVPQEDIIAYLTGTNELTVNRITDASMLEGRRIICLSTCQSPDSTLRTCVFGVINE